MMFTIAQWVTDNPIVIPFVIAGLAYVVFHIYMLIWGAFETAIFAVVVAVIAKVKLLITLVFRNYLTNKLH